MNFCVCSSSSYMIVCLFLSFFSHINQRTQFENPVLEAKRKLGLDTAVATQNQQRAAAPPGTYTPPRILWMLPYEWKTKTLSMVGFSTVARRTTGFSLWFKKKEWQKDRTEEEWVLGPSQYDELKILPLHRMHYRCVWACAEAIRERVKKWERQRDVLGWWNGRINDIELSCAQQTALT